MPILLYLIPFIGIFFVFNLFKGKQVDMSGFFKGGNPDLGSPNGGYGEPTITGEKAKFLSEQLRKELHSVFTSEKSVIDMLSEITEADYILVFNEFGLQPRYSTSSIGDLISGKDLSLTEWLSVEIRDDANKQKLKSLFPNIF